MLEILKQQIILLNNLKNKITTLIEKNAHISIFLIEEALVLIPGNHWKILP